MRITSTVTTREFNLTLNEKELAIILDMGNWDEENLVKHFGFCYAANFFITKEEAVEFYKELWEKMNKIWCED